MRFEWLMAAALATCAMPTSAATIVQTDNETILRGFQGFDTQLGQLDKVTLSISVQKLRTWQIEASVPVGTVKQISWQVNGIWSLNRAYTGLPSDTVVALTGMGQGNATLTGSTANGAFGYFTVEAAGVATLDLPVSSFLRPYIFFDGFDNGYLDNTGADTTLAVQGATRTIHLGGTCGLLSGNPLSIAEDFCGSVLYRLTYDYTPTVITSGVPEPTTWAMMLLGLGMVGFGMRHGSRRSGAHFALSMRRLAANIEP